MLLIDVLDICRYAFHYFLFIVKSQEYENTL